MMRTMQVLNSNGKNRTWDFISLVSIAIIISFLSCPCLSDPRITEASLYCGVGKPPANVSVVPTFVKEFEGLAQAINTSHWATHFDNTTNALLPMYGLAQCHQDLSNMDCLLCYAASRTRLPRCLPSVSARIYLDGCFLRYDNYSFYNESTDPVRDSYNCSSVTASLDGSITRSKFAAEVRFVIGNATKAATAANGTGFGVAAGEGVYALAQCWKTVSAEGCRACLDKASVEAKKCVPKKEGRSMNAGCYLRYSTDKFYNDEAEADNRKSSSRRKGIIIAIVLAVAAFLMLALFGAYAAYAKIIKIKAARRNLGLSSFSFHKSSVSFKYETLEKATDYFSPSTKIGQGGAGSVYKGTLPNGKTVAVKRLIYNTRQWVDEFFNEVNLISGMQHKNLVKLLGCSIEGPESLLVYEYVPNRSLDHFLFEKNKVQILNWKQKFNIIVGTAEGLAYLHGGSNLRIIHRDIKSSNVLLDENLTPKVADFGLVRCFGADKTHLSTGIAGTLGYMAPEYLVRGQLTEKADVYSYGVLVLEIVCGRRNCAFTQDSGSLLQTVWKLYKSDKLAEAVDPSTKGEIPAKEVAKVLQIGLLCTQASASFRPSMTEVVSMLTNKEKEIPAPNQPPFLNATALNPTSFTGSYSSQSLVSNSTPITRVEASYTSTEISSSNSSEGQTRI
ncbi:hypothetical protein CsatA_016428 [Cannabis sativa]